MTNGMAKMDSMTKRCPKRKAMKSFSNFPKRKSRKDGYEGVCKICQSKYKKVYRQKNRDKLNKNRRLYGKEHKLELSKKQRLRLESDPRHSLIYNARQRARKKEIAFNLTVNDITVPAKCPALGMELKVGQRYCNSNSPTIDRIDNTKGYIKGNIIVVSHKANTIKNNATLEELNKVAEFYKKLQDM